MATSGLELRSKITRSGRLELWLEEVTTPALKADEVLIRSKQHRSTRRTLACCSGPLTSRHYRPAARRSVLPRPHWCRRVGCRP